MALFDDIRLRGASDRITEEALYAQALREVEAGQRRDGLWAKALSDCKMDTADAQALYLKLRVRSLRDELELVRQSLERSNSKTHENQLAVSRELEMQRQSMSSDDRRHQAADGSPLGNALAKWLGIILLLMLALPAIELLLGAFK